MPENCSFLPQLFKARMALTMASTFTYGQFPIHSVEVCDYRQLTNYCENVNIKSYDCSQANQPIDANFVVPEGLHLLTISAPATSPQLSAYKTPIFASFMHFCVLECASLHHKTENREDWGFSLWENPTNPLISWGWAYGASSIKHSALEVGKILQYFLQVGAYEPARKRTKRYDTRGEISTTNFHRCMQSTLCGLIGRLCLKVSSARNLQHSIRCMYPQGDHFPDHMKFPDLSSRGKQRLPKIECIPIWSTVIVSY